MYVFRNAIQRDAEEILLMINNAKERLAYLEIDQWQDGYPNQQIIFNDIHSKQGFVLEKNNAILGYCMISIIGEPTYQKIIGSWKIPIDIPYGVIHRLVTNQKVLKQGIASKILQHIVSFLVEKKIYEIKIDTHKGNVPMRAFLEKNGFSYQGIIHLQNGNERLAYEKSIAL